VIVVHYWIDRHANVNFPTKVNTEFYWRISRQRNSVDSGTRVTVFSSINRSMDQNFYNVTKNIVPGLLVKFLKIIVGNKI